MRRRTARAAALAMLLAGLAPPAPATPSADEAQLVALNRQDGRLLRVGYRIAVANRALCPHNALLSGFLVHDAGQYAPALRPAAAAVFGFAGGPTVAAVVAESPAGLAGLKPGDRLVAIGGAPVAPVPPSAKASYAGVEAVNRRIDAALRAGPLQLEIVRAGRAITLRIVPTPGCASLVQLVPSGTINADADGDVVTINTAFADFATSEDELAILVGHEMAHNALGHRQRLRAEGADGTGLFSQFGKTAARIRATEREADYYGLYFMARAGYDPTVAAPFWARFGKAHGLGIFASPTHPGTRPRVRIAEYTAAEIKAKQAKGEPLLPTRVPVELD